MKIRRFFILAGMAAGVTTAALGVLALLEYQSAGAQSTPLDAFENIIVSEEARLKKDNEHFNRAMHYEDVRECDPIKQSEKQEECRDMIAIAHIRKSGNVSACVDIKNAKRQTECRHLTAETTALTENDKSICQYIQDERHAQRCRENIDAKRLADITERGSAHISECESLEDNFRKECQKRIENHRSEAAYYEAIRGTDVAACAALEEEQLALECRDSVLENIAHSASNPALCQQIINTQKRSECERRLSAEEYNAQLERAIQEKNISLCADINDTEIRDTCRDTILLILVRDTNNVTLCDMLSEDTHKDTCRRIQSLP